MRNDLPNERAPNFAARLRETMMTYLGKTGDPLDRGVTLRDLVQSGLFEVDGKPSADFVPLTPGDALNTGTTVDLTPPGAPTGFAVSAAITHIFIEHDAPTYTQGGGHLRTRVYGAIRNAGAPAPVFADAVEIAQFTGEVYAYPTNPATTWHLWIKWESRDGALSQPAGGTNGLVAITGQDVSKLLTALNDQLTTSQLVNSLRTRLNGIETNAAAISQESQVRSWETGELYAQYTVKVNNQGYVSGFGLASTPINGTPYSEFAIVADKFSIAPVATNYADLDGSPFFYLTVPTVINGVSIPAGAYMKAAYIHDATITTAKIQDAAIDSAKIANLAVSTAKINDAAITTAKIADANITNAKIADATIQSAKIADATITSAKIQNGAITNAKIGYAAIDSAQIQNGAITNAKIGYAAVSSANIEDAAISNVKIGTAAVDTLKLAGDSVTIHEQSSYQLYGNPVSQTVYVYFPYSGTFTTIVYCNVTNANYYSYSTSSWELKNSSGSVVDSDIGGGGAAAVKASLAATMYGSGWTTFSLHWSGTSFDSTGSGIGAYFRVIILKRYR